MHPILRSVAMVSLLVLVGQDAPLRGWGSPRSAQEPAASSAQDLLMWLDRYPASDAELQVIAVGRQFQRTDEIRPFAGRAIVGLAINGTVRFRSERALARVLMVDDQLQEHLVYEMYPLLAGGASLQLRNACRESCLLTRTVAVALKVELVDASLTIRSIVINRPRSDAAIQVAPAAAAARERQVREAQESEIVSKLNREIRARGQKWIAGETPISRLTYAEKRRILPCAAAPHDAVLNLQGAEYYTGGILEIGRRGAEPAAVAAEPSTLIEAFDWRSRHGANRPGSPYFDGDPTGGGWMTSVKWQGCGDCWAHSALGATEALVNLYFNQHLDVDLSEQELVSCSGAGTCRYGGNTGLALAYVQGTGVVDERCFPESGYDQACNRCALPQEHIRISGFEFVNPAEGEDNIKRKLIKWGPMPFGIPSWWHALVLTGYEREPGTGRTVWILKNSWGPNWGEQGYGRVVVPLTDIYLTFNLRSPVLSLLAPYAVACRDDDGDGYTNWGLSGDTPVNCGSVRPAEDCDDSDPTVAILTEDGFCTPPPDTNPPDVTAVATPAALWPPNGKMRPAVVSGTIADADSGVDAGSAAYGLSDEYGRVWSAGPIELTSDGRYALTVWLEASRRGDDQDGRRYVITITAQDRAGNRAANAVVVMVPHDRR